MAPGDISPLRLRKKIAQFAKFVMLNCFDPDTGEFDFIKGLMKPSADGSYTFGLANMINPEIDDIGPMVEVEEDEVKRRKKYRRVDWTKTFWYIQYVLDEKGEWSDTTHRNGKLFRTRFVVDLEDIKEVCNAIKALPEDKAIWTDKVGLSAPLELYVLGAFQMLARNWTFDDLYEATGISRQCHAVFPPNFVKWYATDVFPLVVTMPDPNNEEEVRQNGAEYKAAGFTELTVASVDVVHIRQWSTDRNLLVPSTGKEKFPTRAFQVMCNHRRMFLSATTGFYGGTNDLTIVKFDNNAVAIRRGMYRHLKTKVFNKDGEERDMQGGFLINDNGYHKWSTNMNPSKNPADEEEYRWSEMLESLRKDIECVFGAEKQMFAILKYGCRLNIEVLDDVFLTCCAIYNQRMRKYNKDDPWTELIGEYEGNDEGNDLAVFERMRTASAAAGVPVPPNRGLPPDMQLHVDEEEIELGYAERRQMLIEHFNYLLKNGQVKWPRINARWHSYQPTYED